VSSYYYICVLILLILLHMCPHTAIHVSAYCAHCWSSGQERSPPKALGVCVLILVHMCPNTAIYTCPHTAIYVSSYCWHTHIYIKVPRVACLASIPLIYCCICVRMLLNMCPHTGYMCLHTAVYVSAQSRMLLYMCLHTAVYVSAYLYICVRILLYVSSCTYTYRCLELRAWHPSLSSTAVYVSAYCFMCPHTAVYVSACCWHVYM
jgi:hypothetical protein